MILALGKSLSWKWTPSYVEICKNIICITRKVEVNGSSLLPGPGLCL